MNRLDNLSEIGLAMERIPEVEDIMKNANNSKKEWFLNNAFGSSWWFKNPHVATIVIHATNTIFKDKIGNIPPTFEWFIDVVGETEFYFLLYPASCRRVRFLPPITLKYLPDNTPNDFWETTSIDFYKMSEKPKLIVKAEMGEGNKIGVRNFINFEEWNSRENRRGRAENLTFVRMNNMCNLQLYETFHSRRINMVCNCSSDSEEDTEDT